MIFDKKDFAIINSDSDDINNNESIDNESINNEIELSTIYNSQKQDEKNLDDLRKKVEIYNDNNDRIIDRLLKACYAIMLLFILGLQIIFLDYIFFKTGEKVLSYDTVSLNIFITASVIQVFYSIRLIIVHLFPKKDKTEN